MVGKWRRRRYEAANGGRLADCLLRSADDHIASRCRHGLNPPQEWLAMLRDPSKQDVDRLTSVKLSEDARQAVRCAADFVVGAGRTDLFVNVCLTLAARGYDYDPAFVLCAYVGDVMFGEEPPECLEALYRANTTLLPECWMDQVSVEELADRVRQKVVPDRSQLPERGPDWDVLLEEALVEPNDDRLILAAFPARSSQDLGIRYVRAPDLWVFFMENRSYEELRQVLRQLKFFDYICMVNLLLAKVVFTNPQWWDTLARAGCFDGGSEHFRLACKQLSDWVKKENVQLPAAERVCYYECASLYGAMCPPVPGWDPILETRELAQGGQDEHGLLLSSRDGYAPEDFCAAIEDLAALPPRDSPDVRTFREFLESEEWARAGASSIGTVEFSLEAEGTRKTGRFKARKNFLLDVVELDDLERRVRECREQKNIALIKTELSKIRLAVSSPVEVYLPQTWLFLLSGNAYSSWPSNTLEEPLWKEQARHETTWERLQAGEYSLPYDFARFDHQPTTAEIQAFQRATNECARQMVQEHQRRDFEELTANVLQGFSNATLTSPPGLGDQLTFKVTGGLMSGLRSTSCVGSGWNAIFGQFATRLIYDVRGGQAAPHVWQLVRGDDTQVVGRSYHDVLGVKLGYDALGAIANESKFTLRRGRTEFLRVETEDRLRGYPCRTIPLIVQRRPWNARPVRTEAGLDHVAKAASTVRRRIPDPTGLDAFVGFFMTRTCGMLGLDERLLSIPAAVGGLGLRPWRGEWAVQCWSSVRAPPVTITNRTSYRETRVRQDFDKIGVPVFQDEVARMAEERIRSKIASDDIPEFAGIVRRAGRNEILRRKIQATKVRKKRIDMTLVHMAGYAATLEAVPPESGGYSRMCLIANEAQKDHAPEWGICRGQADTLHKLSELARTRREKLGPYLRAHLPAVAEKVRQVERRLRLRRSAAVDFVLGTLSGVGAERLPSPVPQLASKLAAAAVGCVASLMRTLTSHEAMYAFCKSYELFSDCIVRSGYGQVFLTY
nr:MAG: RNA-dependent RNA polymerase [Totiviridae sp.]